MVIEPELVHHSTEQPPRVRDHTRCVHEVIQRPTAKAAWKHRHRDDEGGCRHVHRHDVELPLPRCVVVHIAVQVLEPSSLVHLDVNHRLEVVPSKVLR